MSELLPPEGTKPETYHWLQHDDAPFVALWGEGCDLRTGRRMMWWLIGNEMESSPRIMFENGHRYLEPCLFPRAGDAS